MRRGRADKRCAITEAALRVFGRDGYVRASIDAIAAEAGVSTRTIYNHFTNKEDLFAYVLRTSATEVAEAFVATIEATVVGDDLMADLRALGEAFVAQRRDFPAHFGMVAQIKTEASHVDAAVVDDWQRAGPRRVQRELAARLRRLADGGGLRVADPARAAAHFSALVIADDNTRGFGSAAPSARQVSDGVAAAVEVFVHGYRSGRSST
ncbi:MAG: TetR/AcrR family transcriptional regulator [Stackebrandtia sp.]